MRFLLAAALLSLGACGDDGGSGPSDPPPAAAVDVGNDFYRSAGNDTEDPAVDTVAVNGTVTWTWLPGASTHRVWPAGDPLFEPSDELAGGGEYAVTFATPGTYEYICGVHGATMSGRVVVR
jgi:plastocyanin